MSSKIPPITTRNSEIHHGSWFKSWFKSWQIKWWTTKISWFIWFIIPIQLILFVKSWPFDESCDIPMLGIPTAAARVAFDLSLPGLLDLTVLCCGKISIVDGWIESLFSMILYVYEFYENYICCLPNYFVLNMILRNYNIINVTCPSYDIPKICMYKYNYRVCICFWVSQQNKHHFFSRILLGAYQLAKERERVGKNAGPMSTPHSYMTLEVGSTWVHTQPHWM